MITKHNQLINSIDNSKKLRIRHNLAFSKYKTIINIKIKERIFRS